MRRLLVVSVVVIVAAVVGVVAVRYHQPEPVYVCFPAEWWEQEWTGIGYDDQWALDWPRYVVIEDHRRLITTTADSVVSSDPGTVSLEHDGPCWWVTAVQPGFTELVFFTRGKEEARVTVVACEHLSSPTSIHSPDGHSYILDVPLSREYTSSGRRILEVERGEEHGVEIRADTTNRSQECRWEVPDGWVAKSLPSDFGQPSLLLFAGSEAKEGWLVARWSGDNEATVEVWLRPM